MGGNDMMNEEGALLAFAAYLDSLIAADDFSGVVLVAKSGFRTEINQRATAL